MKIKILSALLLLVPMVFSSAAFARDSMSTIDGMSAAQDAVTSDYQDGIIAEHPDLAPDITERYMQMYGLNWYPEKVNKFARIKRDNNGTTTRVNTPGAYYVNISIPYIMLENAAEQKVTFVAICGQSSKGSKTKPVKWKFYSNNNGKFFSETITWLPNEDFQCISKSFTSPQACQGLMVSVLVNYHNTTHTFTFNLAYIRTNG